MRSDYNLQGFKGHYSRVGGIVLKFIPNALSAEFMHT
jgi:hypothetical protein